MSVTVTTNIESGIAVIIIENPPVNALSAEVRLKLFNAIDESDKATEIDAIILVGEGKNFVGGADIREFGKPPLKPYLPDLCNRIEACQKPVIAALHGVALGGGMEIALSAHYRVALTTAKMGLPEVNLGVIPGSGGTQRTTRITGAKAALDLMLTGRHAKASELLCLGLIDEISDKSSPIDAGISYARKVLDEGQGIRPTRNRAEGLADTEANRQAIKEALTLQQKKSKGLFSPLCIIQAVESALDLPFEKALQYERQLFLECMSSPQREGLIHAFFSERASSKLPIASTVSPRKIESIGIIGGGTMGAGIAVSALDAGLQVTMVERDKESIKRGRANVEKIYSRLVSKGRMSEKEKSKLMDKRFSGFTEYSSLENTDLIIEAVFEDMEIKKSVFAELDKVVKPGAIMATNTSYLDINEIAASISRPEDVIGLHFFSPANIMKLLEIVVADKTSPEVVVTSFALAKQLKKVAVRAGVCDGFIGNRILAVYRQAADYMMEDGASPYEIDQAIRDFGYPMGPYEVSDLAGGDIGWANRKRKAATRDPNLRYVHIADKICELGWYGQKTGRGYYLYENGSRVGKPNPELQDIIEKARKDAGIIPRKFTSEEIIRRYVAAMVNEGANVVSEKIALRPLDVDVALLFGYGFPRWRGGPMKYADSVGLDLILRDIETFSKEDCVFWKPSPLLVELVENGQNFESLNIT